MKGFNPRTIALYLSAVFIAGAIAGGASGYHWGRKSMFRPPRNRDMNSFLIDRMTAELQLNDEQLQQITPIITNTTARIRDLHRETGRQVEAAMKASNEQIRPILSPDQQQKLEELEARHNRWNRDRDHDRSNRTNSNESSNSGPHFGKSPRKGLPDKSRDDAAPPSDVTEAPRP